MRSLEALDEQAAEAVRAARCPSCGARLDRADYARKPRGGTLAPGSEGWCKRRSFCCSREGCRRRATPPSVRFLGRKVYAEVVVLIASIYGQAVANARALREVTGVPARTVRRWLTWWRTAFVASAIWREACARSVPGPAWAELPMSLLSRFPAATALVDMARFMGPMTTGSVPDGSRFLRVTM